MDKNKIFVCFLALIFTNCVRTSHKIILDKDGENSYKITCKRLRPDKCYRRASELCFHTSGKYKTINKLALTDIGSSHGMVNRLLIKCNDKNEEENKKEEKTSNENDTEKTSSKEEVE